MNWIEEIVTILENVSPRTKAVDNAIHVFKYGKGWLTGDLPSKIFFWSDFYDEEYSFNNGGIGMIEKHNKDYNNNAWEQYSIAELGFWVHLLAMRSIHRSSNDKRKKDLYDARNYLSMIDEKLKKIEASYDDNAGK